MFIARWWVGYSEEKFKRAKTNLVEKWGELKPYEYHFSKIQITDEPSDYVQVMQIHLDTPQIDINTETDDLNFHKDPKNKNNIVFVHGYCGSGPIFYKVLKPLAYDNKLTLIDLRGMGESGRTKFKCKTREEFEEYLIKGLEHPIKELKIKDPIIIGHSIGGYVSTLFTQKHPELVKKLILLNVAGFSAREESPNAIDIPTYIKKNLPWERRPMAHMILYIWERHSPFILRHICGKYIANAFLSPHLKQLFRTINQEELEDLGDYLDQLFTFPISGDKGLGLLLKVGGWGVLPLSHRFPKLAVDTSFVFGDRDWMDAYVPRNYAESNGHNFYLVQDAGHDIFLDQPAKLLNILEKEITIQNIYILYLNTNYLTALIQYLLNTKQIKFEYIIYRIGDMEMIKEGKVEETYKHMWNNWLIFQAGESTTTALQFKKQLGQLRKDQDFSIRMTSLHSPNIQELFMAILDGIYRRKEQNLYRNNYVYFQELEGCLHEFLKLYPSKREIIIDSFQSVTSACLSKEISPRIVVQCANCESYIFTENYCPKCQNSFYCDISCQKAHKTVHTDICHSPLMPNIMYPLMIEIHSTTSSQKEISLYFEHEMQYTLRMRGLSLFQELFKKEFVSNRWIKDNHFRCEMNKNCIKFQKIEKQRAEQTRHTPPTVVKSTSISPKKPQRLVTSSEFFSISKLVPDPSKKKNKRGEMSGEPDENNEEEEIEEDEGVADPGKLPIIQELKRIFLGKGAIIHDIIVETYQGVTHNIHMFMFPD